MRILPAGSAFFKAYFIKRTSAIKALSMLGMTALLLQGCGIPGSPEEFHKTAEAKYLQAALNRLASKDYAAIEASFDQRVEQADMQQALQQMHSLLPKEAPIGREPVQWNFQSKLNFSGQGSSERVAHVAIEYAYPSSRWILASATLSGEPANLRMVGFHVQPLPASLADINAFTLRGKGLVHYFFPSIALVSVSVSLFAFVLCLRTQGLKRKWLWAIFTLTTVSTFSLNWTSGEVASQIMRLNILGWGVSRSGWLLPWIMTVSIPVGALIFLWKHGRRKPLDESAVAA